MRRLWIPCPLAIPALLLAGPVAPRAGDAAPAAVVRLGYFPNLTHAQALIAKQDGRFEPALGGQARIEWVRFNAGPSAIEAIFAGQLDMAYIGPSPSLNGFVRSKGAALRVVAGAAEGGAGLVARGGLGIRSVADLAGKVVATPQLGNTQDVALRYALRQSGLAPREKGGSVRVAPMANPDIRLLFLKKEIDAAWVPEPWLAILHQEGGGEVVVDEKSLWPDGRFVTTQLIAATAFLERNRDLARRVVAAHAELTGWIEAHPAEARARVNAALAAETGKPMKVELLEEAWSRIRFTADPYPRGVEEMARRAFELGFLGARLPDLKNLIDPSLVRKEP